MRTRTWTLTNDFCFKEDQKSRLSGGCRQNWPSREKFRENSKALMFGGCKQMVRLLKWHSEPPSAQWECLPIGFAISQEIMFLWKPTKFIVICSNRADCSRYYNTLTYQLSLNTTSCAQVSVLSLDAVLSVPENCALIQIFAISSVLRGYMIVKRTTS